MSSRSWITAVSAAGFVMIAVLMIRFPAPSLEAALRGVSIWWDVLFPALLPFFVIAELMLGFGVVHFFGTLLDPMMRPLFRVPGIGGFVMAMGFASGYPVGARMTSQLWEQQLVNREEGERLVAFTTSSDPIFLIGAVSVGFFHDVGLAVILAAAHYGSCMLIGLFMRFHGGKRMTPVSSSDSEGMLIMRALRAMHRARLSDGRSFGEMLRDAVQNSLRMIFVVGGLVVFFCVVLEVLTLSGVMGGLYTAVNLVLQRAHFPPELSQAVVNGLFEVTLGVRTSAEAGAHLSMMSKAAIGAFILSWAGLSVHAQVMSLLSRTDLRYAPFFAARLFHGLLAAALVFLLWNPLQGAREAFAQAVPSLAPGIHHLNGGIPAEAPASYFPLLSALPSLYTASALIFFGLIACMVMMGAIYLGARSLFRKT